MAIFLRSVTPSMPPRRARNDASVSILRGKIAMARFPRRDKKFGKQDRYTGDRSRHRSTQGRTDPPGHNAGLRKRASCTNSSGRSCYSADRDLYQRCGPLYPASERTLMKIRLLHGRAVFWRPPDLTPFFIDFRTLRSTFERRQFVEAGGSAMMPDGRFASRRAAEGCGFVLAA